MSSKKGSQKISAKGGAKKHTKVIKDEGISSSPGILRIAKAGGSVRTSKDAIEVLQMHMQTMVENIIKQAIIIANYTRRTTIKSKDIIYGYETKYGGKYYGESPNSKGCLSIKKTKAGKTSKLITQVKYYQNQPGCLLLQRARFNKYVRYQVKANQSIVDISVPYRISAQAFLVLQDIVEQDAKNLVINAIEVMATNIVNKNDDTVVLKSKILKARHIQVVRKILKYRS